MIRLIEGAKSQLEKTTTLDFIAPLALRLYLVPIFFDAGLRKLDHIDDIIAWFEHSLKFPAPELMAYLATWTEIIGAACLLVGFAVRWVSIPLLITMFVAIITVHLDHGWAAIAPDMSDATMRLNGFMSWLENNHSGRYEFITELGTPVMLQNGIEYGASYIIMLFALFFYGAGKFVSMDYWVLNFWNNERTAKSAIINTIFAILVALVMSGGYYFARELYLMSTAS